MINCKRVYDERNAEDGLRILVDRLWPRGIKKINLDYDDWNKDVAPSTLLRHWFHEENRDFAEFKARYIKELENNSAAWKPILAQAEKGNITLLFAAKDIQHNQAVVLKAFLENKLKK